MTTGKNTPPATQQAIPGADGDIVFRTGAGLDVTRQQMRKTTAQDVRLGLRKAGGGVVLKQFVAKDGVQFKPSARPA